MPADPDSQKYVAKLRHVREVSLRGTADLNFWKERLEMQGLMPADRDGAAEILIIAAEGRFWGLRFREMSVSVVMPAATADAAYLVQAFNSRKFFAWSERRFFSTPYVHADVRLTTTPPSMELRQNDATVLHAAMGELGDRDPQIRPEALWQGRIFIPNRMKRETLFFVGKLAGEAVVCPFSAAHDRFEMQADAAPELISILRESGFTPQEWSIRNDASHSRSTTYKVP
jgi:hypothetical protein